MRRLVRAALSAALLCALPTGAAPASAQDPQGQVAANVEFLGNIPDVAAVGGKVRTVQTLYGESRYLLATTSTGISAYDVTVPELPLLVSHLLLPHVENEDVEMSDDILLVAQDPAFVTSRLGGMYVIDISQLPVMTFAYVNPASGNLFRVVQGSLAGMETPDQVYTTAPSEESNYYGGHSVSCINDCEYALSVGGGGGSHTLYTIDLRTPSEPKLVQIWPSPVGGTHDAQTDEAGLVWLVGSGGFAAYDFSTPQQPRLVARHNTEDVAYHHNSWRPNAGRYRPRDAAARDADIERGEVLLITEEEIYETCANQGQFATASVVNFDQGEEGHRMGVLDRWTTELRTPSNVGDPTTGNQVAAAVCSAHYFDYRNGIVAIGWYQQGVRFLDVSDPRDIRQVGYFVTPNSATWGALWASDDIVYSVDTGRGIDILRFTGRAGTTAAVRADVPAGWLAAPPAGLRPQPHPTWGYACPLPQLAAG